MISRPSAQTRIRPVAQAFTLIELLLVMVILAILAAVVVPKFTGLSAKAQIQATQAQISVFKTALDAYEVDNQAYPTTEQGLNALYANPGNLPNWRGYLKEAVPQDPWKHDYIYRCPGSNGRDFDLFSAGPDGQEGTSDDIGNN